MPERLTAENVEKRGWNTTGVILGIIIVGLLAVLVLYYFLDLA